MRLATRLARSSPAQSARLRTAARFESSKLGSKHEVWRTEGADTDNLPSVKRRDGSLGEIDKTRGFVDYARIPDSYRDPLERVFDWQEINSSGHDDVERTVQAARCMDCGTPFCQTHTGCPVNNLIPEWNDLVYKGQWREAIDRLHKVLLSHFSALEAQLIHLVCDRPTTFRSSQAAFVRRHARAPVSRA